MNISQVEQVLISLGCTKIKSAGADKLLSSCPYAQWEHKSGKDNNPSFYVKMNGDVPGYSCLSCGMKGTLLSLVFDLGKYSKRINYEVYNFVKQCNPVTNNKLLSVLAKGSNKNKVAPIYSSGPFKFLGSSNTEKFVLSVESEHKDKLIPEDHIDIYFEQIPKKVYKYLTGSLRKLTDNTIAIWELAWKSEGGYISIPIRNFNGGLVGFTGRALDQDKKPKYLHSDNMPRNHVLFGEHKAVKGGKCYLVEGHFDVIWLWQCGYRNVFGVMGSALSEYNAKKLVSWYDEIVFVPDGNDAGKKAVAQWKKVLGTGIRISQAPFIEGKDPNQHTCAELEKYIGKPEEIKMLTSFYNSDIISLTNGGSLTTEEDKIKTIVCSRCNHIFCISSQTEFGKFKNVSMSVSGINILDFDVAHVCDSCVRDIERLLRQLGGKPELLNEKSFEEVNETVFEFNKMNKVKFG